MGFLGALNVCGAGIMFSLSPRTEGVFFGSGIFRRDASGRFNAGLGTVVFFGVSFRTGFFSTGFLEPDLSTLAETQYQVSAAQVWVC